MLVGEFIQKLDGEIEALRADAMQNLADGLYQPLDWIRGVQGTIKGYEQVRETMRAILKEASA
jgi:hypothetical protein